MIVHTYYAHSNFRPVRPLEKAVDKGVYHRFYRTKHGKFFSPSFSVVWIGSHSTFVLCTALLSAEYAEGDGAQSEGQQRPQAL